MVCKTYTTVFKVLCVTPLSPAACSHASVKAQAAGAFSLSFTCLHPNSHRIQGLGEKVYLSREEMAKKEKVLDDEQCTVTPVGFLPSQLELKGKPSALI